MLSKLLGFSYIKCAFALLTLTIFCSSLFAQMPVCGPDNSGGLIYFQNGTEIYNWNPALPFSATNPVLNTISVPAGNFGLAVSTNLNTAGPTPTFYTTAGLNVTTVTYTYYNGANWINSGHLSGSVNIGGGGSALYGLTNIALPITVTKYQGTANATTLLTIPDLDFGGPADIQGETGTDNFYVLRVVAPGWLRKYDGNGNLIYQWTVTGGGGTGGGAGIAIMNAYDRAGGFLIVLTGTFPACPEITKSDSIAVHAYPLVNLGPDTSICLGGNPIVLSNLQPTDTTDRFYWNTGATTPTFAAVNHGCYQLTVTNENDCSTTDEIEIAKDCYIDIPNSFTPNGDGVNDYFFPRQLLSSGVTGFTMQVFNRWGQVIFETNNANGRGWDGKFNAKDQPNGVFVYMINVVLKNGRTERYDGNVTLLR